ncbi:CRE-CPX-2 protein [Caenorhabditis remanei]|uniref:CRE-CPX-2 protein n=2 Tax=Caenorhabditis remanei TaxID=31234 RepID=E3MJQ3_CAERE|nr:CRE-CPX-2 protein [Caenorhabditis remanei]
MTEDNISEEIMKRRVFKLSRPKALSLGAKPVESEEGFDRLTGEPVEPEMEDPDVIAARQEQEKRRKDKHRRMEADRERMRQQIRNKYNLKKKEEAREQEIAGRIAGNRKTPEQVALETLNAEEDDGIMTAINDTYEKAKSTVASACSTMKNVVSLWKT